MIELYTLIAITLVTVITPGPDFLIVARNTMVGSRKAGMKTAFGISTAIWVHIAYSIVIVNLASAHSVWVVNMMKYAGAGYLFYLGINALKSQAGSVVALAETVSSRHYWRQGFINNVLNPKATLFFLSVFSQLISPSTEIMVQLGYGVVITLICLCWFSLVTVLLSVPRVTPYLNKVMSPFEKVAGVLFISFAVAIVI
ncbi:LysE family translocator [Photobacterium lutimaris]|uniref:Amino acid transporter n=1 Tax=Photobacterium lutimaris TaxID=388278 RepID=A0A2T3J2J4_9GAMM|nr:LysE family transporter [Photobacterium lutimaris]PSU35508.1 amino acid transporter [Photobacterium lutimaris]TDR78555.1 threonine/homoserine/homoserine lactone efflux protein [Photobacterium lutimaris]